MTAIDEIITAAAGLGCAASKAVPMSEHTSFKIGGTADLVVRPNSDKNAALILKKCHLLELSAIILGNGSNVLVSDEGIRGVVILTSDISYCKINSDGIIECGSGVNLSHLCNFALENSLSGLEFAYGIPGSTGGAAFMNAGAFNGEMKDVLLSCNHISKDYNIGTLAGSELELGYRESAYSHNGYFITALYIRLTKDNPKDIKNRMADNFNKRLKMHPLDFPNAGSVFKRPHDNYAGKLIQNCGLMGKSVGGAMISNKHAGFIINTGGATAKDVLTLIEIVKDTVFKEMGIVLETEIKFVQSLAVN